MAGPAHVECTHCGKAFPTIPTYERHLTEVHFKVPGARQVGAPPSLLPKIMFGLGVGGGAVVVLLFLEWLVFPRAMAVGAIVTAVIGLLVGLMAYTAWGEL